jgi:hypothetical protein
MVAVGYHATPELLTDVLPGWDGTLEGLMTECVKREWEIWVAVDMCGPGARSSIYDWNDIDPKTEYPRLIGFGVASGTAFLEAATRAMLRALDASVNYLGNPVSHV